MNLTQCLPSPRAQAPPSKPSHLARRCSNVMTQQFRKQRRKSGQDGTKEKPLGSPPHEHTKVTSISRATISDKDRTRQKGSSAVKDTEKEPVREVGEAALQCTEITRNIWVADPQLEDYIAEVRSQE